MHLDDVRLRGGGESLLYFLVSRRSFGSSEFIVVVTMHSGFVMGATMFT